MAHAVDAVFLAKYPFVSDAKSYVQEAGYSLADMLEDVAFERSRSRALSRVAGAIEQGSIEEVPLSSAVDAELELLSYPLARALAAQLDDPYVANRVGVAESKLFRGRVKDEDNATLRLLAAELGVRFEDPALGGFFVRLPFVDYLRAAPTRDDKWKLVNQIMDQGFVHLSRVDSVRLLEEAYKARVVQELSQAPQPGPAVSRAYGPEFQELQMRVARRRARFAQESGGEVRLEAFPPCMEQIWAGIKAHANIPHMGRFAIVAFLHKLGMDAEAILEFFSAVPDFDPNKSRYQIDHITGRGGGSTEYTPPTCTTMATYGICPLEDRDELCHQVTHPLTYYRRRVRALPQKKTKPPQPRTVEAAEVSGDG